MPQVGYIPSRLQANQRPYKAGRLTRRLAPALGILLAVFGCGEEPTSPSAPEQTAALAATSAALAFIQVSGGGNHSCGVTADNQAYCWGYNTYGQLGDGTTTSRLKPVPIGGALRFRQITAGELHTCGVTPDNRAYCWGEGTAGSLGDGTKTTRSAPVAVAGGHLFRRLDAGSSYTCGVSYPDNRAYCWGYNDRGNLGDGTNSRRATPAAVSGGLQFRDVRAGLDATCGVTPTNVAYCWGSDSVGQLGNGEGGIYSLTPSPVAGGLRFIQVDAGSAFACGVTTGYRAFCWGSGRRGQIGDGKTYLRFTPRAVAGGFSFDRVTTGESHTCGETRDNRAYCWGSNFHGQLGDGSNTSRLTPVAVTGGRFFSQVSAGYNHTCGRTAANVAYCWGSNDFGQIGDGTRTDRLRPVAVVGP